MEDFILFFPFSFHFLLDGLFGVLKLAANVMVSYVLVVVNVPARSPGPHNEHSQGPDQEKYQDDAGADEELVGDVVARQVADVLWKCLHGIGNY